MTFSASAALSCSRLLDPRGGLALTLRRRRSDHPGFLPRATLPGQSGRKESVISVQENDPANPAPETLARWLLAVAQAQDREAFAGLHAYFAPRLTSWLSRSGFSAAQIEDIVQETMISVWRKAARYNPAHGGASTWIFVIARNLRIDFLRRGSNRENAALEHWDQIYDGPGGEESLLAAEREGALRRALAKLTREQAAVLEQAYFAEKPQSAIARELGVPLGTVKSRVRLALARLRALLEENP